ncbi:D-alanyl-D-alanine carboxypeptidase precursor [Nonomuraea coxensis DSM 45129]|uniref:D-alanyl-D-alanine carboxypeptidase n=1 Tax=Nonomuraea coxensis DSM 45129 TaxID=1122611 RepID=A0ABX8TSE1_9ACTN|nr:serine hydrolase domain-containing protein [Nonomuraea coxensis]QYC38390.1 D-alanyl-D-alanine carboxypeptidase precursor [Nonomuraea coxensis DSM 45129]
MRRARQPRTAVLSILVLGLVAAPSSGVRAAAEPGVVPRSDRAALQRVLDEAVRQGSPGALAQSRAYGVVRNLSSGVADITTRRPPRADMRFRAGSVTKTFVATAILRLVATGRLHLDDTVGEVLPGVVPEPGGDTITIRMLLNHTSGLYDYTADPRLEQIVVSDPAHCFTPAELVRFATQHPLSFPPGTSWAYSNTDYSLLAMVIEKITGRSYAEEITRTLLRPLGLRDTYFPGCSPLIRGPHMSGYTRTDPAQPGIQDVTTYNPSFAAGEGDIISTVGDLNRFDAALLAGRLLPARLLRMMLTPTPGSFPGSDTFRYGLGVVIATASCGVTTYGHAGEIQGWQTWMSGTRGGRHTMSFVLNSDWLDQGSIITRAVNAEYCGTP